MVSQLHELHFWKKCESTENTKAYNEQDYETMIDPQQLVA